MYIYMLGYKWNGGILYLSFFITYIVAILIRIYFNILISNSLILKLASFNKFQNILKRLLCKNILIFFFENFLE